MPLTEQELHNLAMNIVGEALQELGWEFLLVNSDRKKNPQFVCIDPQGQKSFIIVRPILQGDDPKGEYLLYKRGGARYYL